MPKLRTQQDVLDAFRAAHGDRYGYELVRYRGTQNKVTVVCRIHGTFDVLPNHHENGTGCRRCYFDRQRETRAITKKAFIETSQTHFGDRYDYSRLPDPPLLAHRVMIWCKDHEMWFEQEARAHMRGHTACIDCISERLAGPSALRGKIRSEEQIAEAYIDRAKEKFGDRFDYCKITKVRARERVTIRCVQHGEFPTTFVDHLKSDDGGCPLCWRETRWGASFKAKCTSAGTDYWRALKRREAGLPSTAIMRCDYIRSERMTRQVTVAGKTFPNLIAAANASKPKAHPETIRRWIKRGLSPEEAMSRTPGPGIAAGMIYCVTDMICGKKYVGQTVQSLDVRKQQHIENAQGQRKLREGSLAEAIRKRGTSAFHFEVLASDVPSEQLGRLERHYIETLSTRAPCGYNLSGGGETGGSLPKSTEYAGTKFRTQREAATALAMDRGLSVAGAAYRLRKGIVDHPPMPKPGFGVCTTKEYKVWSRIFLSFANPSSKHYKPELIVEDAWRSLAVFLNEVGRAPARNARFEQINKKLGYIRGNVRWMTPTCKETSCANYLEQEDAEQDSITQAEQLELVFDDQSG